MRPWGAAMAAPSQDQGASHIPIHLKYDIDFETFGKEIVKHPAITQARQDPEPPSTTAPAARCQHDHVMVMLVASTQGCGGGAACPGTQNEPRQEDRDDGPGRAIETLEQLLVVPVGEGL